MAKFLTCSEDTIMDITPEKVWNIVRGDKKEAYLLVDVRTPEEYTEEHLPGARLVPLHELDQRYGEIDRKKKIITYCRSGRRSMGGAILLCNQGFRQLHNMEGGIMNWPYEKIKGPPEEAEEFFKDIAEIKELLFFAIQTEKASRSFYFQAAQKLKEKDVKDLLNKLSRAEEKHAEHIHNRLKDIWPEVPPLREIKESEFTEGKISLPQSLLGLEENPPQEKMDVLEIALEKECKAFDLYQRMAAGVEATLKEFFQDLADQERGHIDELSRLL